jgi:Ca-activated chloride channel family protein
MLGLTADTFQVFEDGIRQEIIYFRETNTDPVSVGFILDRSASMKFRRNIDSARAAILNFVSNARPGDNFFVLAFNQDTKVISDWTDNASSIRRQIADGATALYDALYYGFQKIRNAKNDRKALILITDGEDNSSSYTFADIEKAARETNVQVYAIGEEGDLGLDRYGIERIVKLTGGRAFFPWNFNDLEKYIGIIQTELRHQYILGYVPKNARHDGKWRTIKIRVDAPTKVVVRARAGYYAAVGKH